MNSMMTVNSKIAVCASIRRTGTSPRGFAAVKGVFLLAATEILQQHGLERHAFLAQRNLYLLRVGGERVIVWDHDAVHWGETSGTYAVPPQDRQARVVVSTSTLALMALE